MSTGASGFDLRRLVLQAVPLVPVSPLPTAKAHPLGFGLRNDHSFDLGTGAPKLRFPKANEAIQRLGGQISEADIPGISTELHEAAWHALFTKPSLVVQLSPPTAEDLLYLGIDVSASDVGRLKVVGLSAVLSDSSMALQSGKLHAPPCAAYGRVFLLTKDGAPHISVDGWTDIAWTNSTPALVRGLQELYRDAQQSTRALKNNPRVGMLIGEGILNTLGEAAVARLTGIAAVHKLDLVFYRHSRNLHNSVKSTLKREPPSNLLVAIDRWEDIQDIIAAYERSVDGRVRSFRSVDPFSFDAEFCDFLCGLVGVNGGLLPLEVLSDEEETPAGESLPEWPIERIGERRRHNSFGHVVESLDDKRWYVRDDTGHAECRFKRYKLVERTFEHEADLDRNGKVIPKHKGERGKRIDYDETFAL